MNQDEPSAVECRLIDARFQLLEKVWGDVPKLYNHAVLAQVGLPYRDQKEARFFQRVSGGVALQMEAGALPTVSGEFELVGLPYGPRARILLLHLCSAAVLNQSPIVEVDDSFTAFAKTLGLAHNGRNIKTLRDQVRRMSVVQLRLAKSYGDFVDVFQGPIFSKLRAMFPADASQQALWPSYVEFSADFYNSLRINAVPLRKEAISALKHSSRALDIYSWLAHRLYRVKRPTKIRWTTLRVQFGRRSQDMGGFKRAFKTALKQVLMVYPDAQVFRVDGGLRIENSRPPVPFKKRSVLEG